MLVCNLLEGWEESNGVRKEKPMSRGKGIFLNVWFIWETVINLV